MWTFIEQRARRNTRECGGAVSCVCTRRDYDFDVGRIARWYLCGPSNVHSYDESDIATKIMLRDVVGGDQMNTALFTAFQGVLSSL